MDDDHGDRPEATVHISLGAYLRSRYWGRVLLLGIMTAVGLGLIDAVVPILNWQLALVALCTSMALAVHTREQLLVAVSVLLPASGVQLAMYMDRPDAQRSMILWFSLSLLVFVFYIACTSRPRSRAPRHPVLNFADGRQVPLLVGKPPGASARHWHAISRCGPIYLNGDWTVSHAGPRRAVVEPVVYHDESGVAYIPDVHGLRDTL